MSFKDSINLYSDKPYVKELIVTEDSNALLLVDENNVVHFNIPDKSPAVIRKRIWDLKDYLFSLPEDLTQTNFEDDTEHTFMDGVYTRKLFIKKGTIILGKIHLKKCTNIVAMGDCTILTETGCNRVSAGFVGISPQYSQKLVYAHEDTVFINIFITDETDVEKVEAELLSEDYNDLRDLSEEVVWLEDGLPQDQ